jgi:thioredoxin-related protein
MRLARPLALALLMPAFVALVILAAPSDKKTAPADASKKSDNTKETAINWLPFDQALAKAKAENKNLFVDLTASWCGWCKKMEKETFSQPEVIEMVNKNFIPARVWGDSDNKLDIQGYKISERDLATSAFQVTGYPTFYFLCPDGKGYSRIIGYRPKDALLTELAQAQTQHCDSGSTPGAQKAPANKPDTSK